MEVLNSYNRKEIKDISAYMRLVVNPKDDVSFRRVINTPVRGLGKTTLDRLEDMARQKNLSLLEASIEALESDRFKFRTLDKLRGFLQVLSELRRSCSENDLDIFYRDLLQITEYLPGLEKEDSMEARGRVQNLEEFGNAIARYLELNPGKEHITDFLDHMALVSDGDEREEKDSVTLMTLHVAKGLEYPVVFVTGLEEGLFPLGSSMDSEEDLELEEERRLFYVGMTRAEEKLYLSHARQRKVWGQNKPQIVSRFLKEIPEKFLKNPLNLNLHGFTGQKGFQNTKTQTDPFPDYEKGEGNASPYSKGTRVRHPHFGGGVIYAVEGSGSKQKISVLFDDRSSRKFLSQYANLELV